MTVDGQDVEAVHATATRALAHARKGSGPVFLLAETYRLVGHYVGDPQVYRPKGEQQELRETQDPLEKLRPQLGLSDDELEAIDAEVVRMVEGSVEFARNAHRAQARGRPRERLCLSCPTEKRCATRCRRRCGGTTRSSSWARTSPRWAARWASPRACSPSSGRSACATRRSPRWRSSAPGWARRSWACARSSRSCTRTSSRSRWSSSSTRPRSTATCRAARSRCR